MRSLGPRRALCDLLKIVFKEGLMKDPVQPISAGEHTNRRSFLRKGVVATCAATVGAGLLSRRVPGFDQEDEKSGKLTKGDAAILRFLAAAEILETDLWVQYNELGGVQDSEVPGGSGSRPYTAALQVLDGDMPQYIHDNTEDEFTHEDFINAYLTSEGADIVNLDQFRTLPRST